MANVIRQFHETVSKGRALFSSCVMARDRDDGSWEGWLEPASTIAWRWVSMDPSHRLVNAAGR